LIGCYRACNDYGTDVDSRSETYVSRIDYLLELQDRNERAGCRIIGLSIETRPDYITDFEIERLRKLGVTKVEVGVQHLDDAVLKLTQRDMQIARVKVATEKMRNAGFKIVYHMMPNLPGSTPERDISMFGELFSGVDFQPDMLKIYPCVVLDHSELYETWKEGLPAPRPGVFFVYVILCDDDSFYIGQTGDLLKRYREHKSGTGAEHTKKHKPVKLIHCEEFSSRTEAVLREKMLKTGFGRLWLKREWKAGRTRQAGGFRPYSDAELVEVLRGAKQFVPPYVRILRVIRDIPASYIKAGSTLSNLRQVMDEDMKKHGWQCRCIRCREIREEEVDPKDFSLSTLSYRTQSGIEHFLSFERDAGTPSARLASFTRLRLPDNHGKDALLPVLRKAALIREMHTYGRHTKIGGEGEQGQHVGSVGVIAMHADFSKRLAICSLRARISASLAFRIPSRDSMWEAW
jgi:histone acetyltransferase (RNA polymerase elongator complex component)